MRVQPPLINYGRLEKFRNFEISLNSVFMFNIWLEFVTRGYRAITLKTNCVVLEHKELAMPVYKKSDV